ncbi:hypothetical protein WOLCODRAFT_20864 [Wolfiporia cocos MD-104 SS10]|uniref:Uncharacterized protein n=1 Tax=Wolfiporia cocos (strain MD-104) TaxID=742152 RepID=A0A2H3J417_WOLCO|nr:hypothetical protein WOLCODRAFT_20864 [Wolfiporia cocos MD-104 SS10]
MTLSAKYSLACFFLHCESCVLAYLLDSSNMRTILDVDNLYWYLVEGHRRPRNISRLKGDAALLQTAQNIPEHAVAMVVVFVVHWYDAPFIFNQNANQWFVRPLSYFIINIWKLLRHKRSKILLTTIAVVVSWLFTDIEQPAVIIEARNTQEGVQTVLSNVIVRGAVACALVVDIYVTSSLCVILRGAKTQSQG